MKFQFSFLSQIVNLRTCRTSAFKSIGELKETVQQLQADLTLANQKLKSVRQHSQVKINKNSYVFVKM